MGYTNLTIIYNSLDVIVLCGLLRKINGINGLMKYDLGIVKYKRISMGGLIKVIEGSWQIYF